MYGDSLANHLPFFPDPEEDPDYNLQISRKAEYRRHAKSNPRQSINFLNHQKITQFHMSSVGGNRHLLIFKPPGVGKTCDAIGVAEMYHAWRRQHVSDSDPFFKDLKLGRSLIVSQNKTTQTDSFKNDIMRTCTAGAYMTAKLIENNYKDDSDRLSAETVSMSKNYELHTHEAFAKYIDTLSPEDIARRHSFQVIVFDEIQQYRVTAKSTSPDGFQEIKKQITKATTKLVDNVYGSVIIIISATPTFDNIDEFPSVINFMLPKSERINASEFTQLTTIDDLAQLKTSLEEYLTSILIGKVSYMKLSPGMSRTIVRTNQKLFPYPLMKYSKKELWISKVSRNDEVYDFNYLIDAYQNAYINQRGIYVSAIQASFMIWPGGTTKVGKDTFIRKVGDTRTFTTEFINDFYMHVVEFRQRLITINAKKLEIEKVKPPSEERDGTIAALNHDLNELQRRNANIRPGVQPFNPDDIYDLQILLGTIRSYYSPVIADVIEQIIGLEYIDANGNYAYIATPETNRFDPNQFNPNDIDNRECAYIYNDYTKNGIFPVCLFLEFFGYTPFPQGSFIDRNGDISTTLKRAKRYALLYSTDEKVKKDAFTGAGKKEGTPMSDARIRKILEVANHPMNKYGHYLKVLAGTEITAQGLNMKNIRQAHMTTRGWNEGQDIQAEGRVDRPESSHLAFLDSDPIRILSAEDMERIGIDATIRIGVQPIGGKENNQRYVKLFRHVAYYPELNDSNGNNISIGLKMYDTSAFKGLKNGVLLDVVSRIAYDYYLNSDPRDPVLGQQLGTNGIDPRTQETDYVNYNMFYARKELEEIKCQVRGLFKVSFKISLADLLSHFPSHHQTTVTKALTEMINDNERIIDRHGCLNYIREFNDIFFLQKILHALKHREDQWLSYYSSHQFVKNGLTIKDIFDLTDKISSKTALEKIMKIEDLNSLKSELVNMPSTHKAFIVEDLVSNWRHYGTVSSEKLSLVFEALYPYAIHMSNRNWIVHVFNVLAKKDLQSGGHSTKNAIPEVNGKDIRLFKPSEGVWRNVNREEADLLRPVLNENIAGFNGMAIGQWNMWGTVSVGKWGLKTFNLQFRDYMEASSSTNKTNKKLSRRGPGDKGQNAKTLQKTLQAAYLWDVDVDVYVYIQTWSPMNGINPIVIVRLEKDPNGQFRYDSVKLSPYVDPVSKKVHLLSNYLRQEDLKDEFIIRRQVRRYTHVYPEIMGWILEAEVRQVLQNPSTSHNNPNFYPQFNAGEIIHIRNYVDGYDDLFDILPEGNNWYMKDIILGIGSFNEKMEAINNIGYIDAMGKRVPFFSGVLLRSLNSLYERINANLDIDDVEVIGEKSVKRNQAGIELQAGSRFRSIWDSAFNQTQFASFIYLMYMLKGRINYA